MSTRKEQDHPGTSPMVHPPIVVLLCIGSAYLLGRLIPLPFAAPAILRYIGLALTIAGLLLGLGAFIEFQKAQTTLDPHGSTTQLVTSGIYRFSRNPIYLGFLLIVIGLPLYLGLFWGIVMAPVFVFLMNHLVIQHEERYLEGKFKEAYTEYRSRVRRWL
ncbi:MAG TPA: isoprenylcysteine carboxylmethyltransferase family protein [Anaerolineales bacterium]|nr:isoprenylcysteine carboxylmethyltransferase family protein [Anaerolineales bacterium]